VFCIELDDCFPNKEDWRT